MADLKMKMTDEGMWEVEDYTNTDGIGFNYFKSIWNMEYELMDFLYDRRKSMHMLKDASHYDNRRCKLAVSRHQRFLLQETGVVDKPKIETKHMLIIQKRSYTGVNPVAKIQLVEVIEQKSKLKARDWSYNKSDIAYIEVTPELQDLADEYNESIDIFMTALYGLQVEIFGTRCDNCREYSRRHKYRITEKDWPENARRWEKAPKEFCCDFCYADFCKHHNIVKLPRHMLT